MQKKRLAEGAAGGRNELNEFQEEQEGQCGWNVVTQGGVARLGSVSAKVQITEGLVDHGKEFGFYSSGNGRLQEWEG